MTPKDEEELKLKSYELEERNKELNCLYDLSRLIEEKNNSLIDIFKGLVNIIPSAFRFPEICCAKLSIGGQEYKTDNYKETEWQISIPIVVEGEKKGFLVVGYLIKRPEYENKRDAFSKEESFLLNTICERLGRVIERKNTEKELRDSRERIYLLMNSAAEAIYEIDLNGNCTFCNKACLQMLRYESESDLIGKNMHQKIHYKYPDGTPLDVKECKIFRAFLSGENSHVDDEVLWRSDGTSFMAEYWSYPKVKDGEVLGAVVTFLDITSRKTAENQLKDSLRETRKMNEYMVGRELKMVELKKEIKRLEEEVLRCSAK